MSIHNLQRSLNQENYNFQNSLITATEENKKTFNCNIEHNTFGDFYNDESTLSKDTINARYKHTVKINLDLHNLTEFRKEFENNPAIGYLNIKHLGSQTDSVRNICCKSPIDVLCTDKTKPDSSHSDLQLKILGYQYSPYCKDQNKYKDVKIVFLGEGLIARRLRDFEQNTTETICLECTISKKIWFFVFAYRPPNDNSKDIFFSAISNSLNRAAMIHDNLLLIGI